MTTPAGDDASLHELELLVKAELTVAQSGPQAGESFCMPIEEWQSDPADDQRYEASLRSLLGAVEALEDGSGPEREGW